MTGEEFSVDVVIPVAELETLLLMAVGWCKSPTDDGSERNVDSLIEILERRAVVISDPHRKLLARAILELGDEKPLGGVWRRALRALEKA